MIPRRLYLLPGGTEADEGIHSSWRDHHPDWQITAGPMPAAEMPAPGAAGLEWICQVGGVVVTPTWRALRRLDDLLVACEAFVPTFRRGEIPAVWGAVAGHQVWLVGVFEALMQRPDVRGIERDLIVCRQ